ncbi:hypothetical protein GGS21DRAFT_254406 [Xylaria nigripes]|nr:hypothetical protein GGS21DRAFT_254406 [Xylaria nigripes]
MDSNSENSDTSPNGVTFSWLYVRQTGPSPPSSPKAENTASTDPRANTGSAVHTSLSQQQASNMSSDRQVFSYSYYGCSGSTSDGGQQEAAFAERSYTDRTGTTTERMHQLPGQQPVYESESTGSRRVTGPATGVENRITDVSDEQPNKKERKNGKQGGRT